MERKKLLLHSRLVLGPALPDYIFHEGELEEESIKDHQSDHPDLAIVFENNDDSNSENAGSETEI